MKILDRYILFRFLKAFFFVVLIVVAIICVIDYTEKTDDFIEKNAPMKAILFDYYLNYIPFIANSLSPISIFIATIFVTSRMASHTEIVAMQASGMSFGRLLRPYLMGAFAMGILAFILVGWVVPSSSRVKLDFELKYIKSPFFWDERNSHFRVSDSTFMYMESYNNRAGIGYRFTLQEVRGERLYEQLYSERITWVDSLKKWRTGSYIIHTFHEDGKESIKKGEYLDTVFNMTPEDFEQPENLYETFTIDELNTFVEKQLMRGVGNVERYRHEKYERQAYPFAIVLLTIMGVIVAHRKSRHGSGLQIVMGFVLAFAYILLAVMSRSIAKAGTLPPLLAAWVPNITFTLITLLLYYALVRKQ